jgi:hypothetical protein
MEEYAGGRPDLDGYNLPYRSNDRPVSLNGDLGDPTAARTYVNLP